MHRSQALHVEICVTYLSGSLALRQLCTDHSPFMSKYASLTLLDLLLCDSYIFGGFSLI